MALSNTRITTVFTGMDDTDYYVYVDGVSTFTGRFCMDSYNTYDVDITDILKPYVHAEEITDLTSGSGPASVSWSVVAVSAGVSPSSGTVTYCNDFATSSIGTVEPDQWGVASISGQYYFSYAAQGAWTGAQYGSWADTCQYNAEIVFTDIWGMPQGVPVKAVASVQATWEGYQRAKDYQSSQHRLAPTDVEKQMTFTCYTPHLTKAKRRKLARWLGQAEFVYLYDIEEGQLHPCVTPTVAEGNATLDKLTITLQTNY